MLEGPSVDKRFPKFLFELCGIRPNPTLGSAVALLGIGPRRSFLALFFISFPLRKHIPLVQWFCWDLEIRTINLDGAHTVPLAAGLFSKLKWFPVAVLGICSIFALLLWLLWGSALHPTLPYLLFQMIYLYSTNHPWRWEILMDLGCSQLRCAPSSTSSLRWGDLLSSRCLQLHLSTPELS